MTSKDMISVLLENEELQTIRVGNGAEVYATQISGQKLWALARKNHILTLDKGSILRLVDLSTGEVFGQLSL
jgi:hypothetical protein